VAVDDLVARLDSIARAPVEAGEIIGLSVAVVRGESSIFTGAHGLADRDAGVPMSVSTPLRLASVSKMMTGALALRLEAAGTVSLAKPLADLVPEVRGAVPPQVTLAAALSHTSGLPDYLEDYFASDEGYYATGAPLAESFVFRYVGQTALRFPPGRHWAYSNTGFYLAAVALERASGARWDELIRDSLAVPLGLESLRTCDEVIARGDLRGYEVGEASVRESPMYGETGVKGDGGLAMTATDLAACARGLERGGVLDPGVFARMITPTHLQDGTEVDYGIGARLGSLGGRRMWGHTGSLESYVGAVLRFPDDDVTVAVLQNTANAVTGALIVACRLAEAALDLPPASPRRTDGPFDPAACVGDYLSWGESREPLRSRISGMEGGLVRVWLGTPESAVALLPLGRHEFGSADWPRDRFRFHGRDGRAHAYSVYRSGLFAGYHWRVE
jgi:CubicO group peptidase (beta-lactamase class C family)